MIVQQLRGVDGFAVAVATPPLELSDQMKQFGPSCLDPENVAFSIKSDKLGLSIPDIFYLSLPRRLILNEQAHHALHPYFEGCGRFVEVVAEGEEYYFHITEPLDCLNQELSTLSRFDDGRIMSLRHPVFHESRLDGRNVFCVPDYPSLLFVNPSFGEAINSSGLTGVKAEEIKVPKERTLK